jgi:hypothetical protein
MSVTKTTGAEVYSVKNAGEWATIIVRSWAEPTQDGEMRHRGELLINSTFGSWSNYWSAPGVPFKQFLAGVEFDYLMSKLMGRELEEHDGYSTFNHLKARILLMRRKGQIDKEAASWIWREVDERHESLEGDVERFVDACESILEEAKCLWSTKHTHYVMDELSELFDEPWLHTKTRVNPTARGFWRDIWGEFVKVIEDEIVAETETAYEKPRG